jgi:hypothetical protein
MIFHLRWVSGTQRDSNEGPEIFDHFLDWKAQEGITLTSEKTSPDTLAKKLKSALDAPFLANQRAFQAFKLGRDLLESKDPDIFMQWPEIFAELARLPNGDSAVGKLLKYPRLVRLYPIDLAATSSLKEAPRPYIFNNKAVFLEAMDNVFKDSVDGMVNHESGKAIIHHVVSFFSAEDVQVRNMLLWASRQGLIAEVKMIVRLEKAGQFKNLNQRGLTNRVLVQAAQTALEANHVTVYEELVGRLDDNVLSNNFFSHLVLTGKSDAAEILFDKANGKVKHFWTDSTLPETHVSAENLLQHVRALSKEDYVVALHYAINFNHDKLLHVLLTLEQSRDLTYMDIYGLMASAALSSSLEATQVLLNSHHPLIVRFKAPSLLLGFLYGDSSVTNVFLDKYVELHGTDVARLMNEFGIHQLDSFRPWYETRKKEFSREAQCSIKEAMLKSAAKMGVINDDWNNLKEELVVGLGLIDEQHTVGKILTDVLLSGSTLERFSLSSADHSFKIIKTYEPDDGRRKEYWSALLQRSLKLGVNMEHFHYLFLQIKEIEASSDFLAQLVSDIHRSGFQYGYLKSAFEHYFEKAWE